MVNVLRVDFVNRSVSFVGSRRALKKSFTLLSDLAKCGWCAEMFKGYGFAKCFFGVDVLVFDFAYKGQLRFVWGGR